MLLDALFTDSFLLELSSMINIYDKHHCCGCSTCIQRCPKQCISLHEDEEGFLYPEVDLDLCVDCGVCEKVCPVVNQSEQRKPLYSYAAINPKDDIRKKSSSGGIFSAIAERVIKEGGVVFGARYNEKWEVEHSFTEAIEGLNVFRGSKYVQSRIGTSFIEAERFLKEGRTVLFSGTSCQIAGLNHFLHKSYANLITADVVCHGVPSPKLWREYLATISTVSLISSVCMKDKSRGWRGYNITITSNENNLSERASANKYMLAFAQNLSLRPSCYQCPAKAGKSCSDITLADYWGVEKLIPSMDDDHGTSFVCANTEKGEHILRSLTLKMVKADYATSVPFNACIEKSTAEPIGRQAFWQNYQILGISVLQTLSPVKPSFLKRIIRRIYKH